MSKYPVEIPFKFSQEIDIKEEQLPFVKISVLTDNIPDETIEFFPSQATPVYTPTWYVYGDDTLLYAGDTIRTIYGIGHHLGYTAKYLFDIGDRYRVYWDSTNRSSNYNMYWHLSQSDGKYRPALPFNPYRSTQTIMPYTNITIKRNTGISDEEANGINPSFDIPAGYTYPNLRLSEIMRFPNAQNTTSKIWLKTGINKYRLIVYGRFCKWTDKKIIEGEGNYIKGVYNYVPYYQIDTSDPLDWRYTSWYKLASYTEISKNIKLYEASLNPSNIRLLVNYVNNSGQNEVRKYDIQT